MLGYLTKENDFKSGFSVCKSWNKILKNPFFWLKKLKQLNLPDEDKKWLNSTLKLILIHFTFRNKELSRSFQEKMFCLKKLKYPALEWKGFSDANIELAKSLRRKYFFIEENTKYVCNTCKKGFPTPAILNCHQKIHLFQCNFRSDVCFYCADCKIGYRIHRHLAKHLQSKSHIMKLENVEKLPIGTYAKLEHLGTDFDLIDTSSCESSLESLKTLAAAL